MPIGQYVNKRQVFGWMRPYIPNEYLDREMKNVRVKK